MRIELSPKHLAAALNLAATNDVRFYLNGVQVDAREREVRYTATDGTALLVVRHLVAGDRVPPLIVPREAAAELAKVKSERLTIESEDGKVWGYRALQFNGIDGRYPDVARVIPREVSGEAGNYSPELVGRFAKAAKALGAKPAALHIHNNGQSTAIVSLAGVDDFCGAVMPCSAAGHGKPVPAIQTWVHY